MEVLVETILLIISVLALLAVVIVTFLATLIVFDSPSSTREWFGFGISSVTSLVGIYLVFGKIVAYQSLFSMAKLTCLLVLIVMLGIVATFRAIGFY